MSERPLRIAIFGESYLPYLSGVTVSTEALARGLGAAGHEVLLVAPRPARGRRPGKRRRAGARPARRLAAVLPAPRSGAGRLPGAMARSRRRRSAPPPRSAADVVHAQSPFTSGLMARRVARRVGAPLVFTHHTRFGDYGHYLGPLARARRGRCSTAYLRRSGAGCAAIVAPGSELATRSRRRLSRPAAPGRAGHPDRHRGGRHRPRSPASTRGRRPAGRADALVVATLGRLAPEKSVDLAGRRLRRRGRRRARRSGCCSSAAGRPRRRFGQRAAAAGPGRTRPLHRPAAARRGARAGEGRRPLRLRLADRDPGPGPGRGARRSGCRWWRSTDRA